MGHFFSQIRPTFWLLWLSLASCYSAPSSLDSSASELVIASSDYVVLAQKALAYQADFNTDSWTRMLADSIEYDLLEGAACCRGKPAVVLDWQQGQTRSGVQAMRLSGFTSLPVVATQPLPISGRSGVHIFTYCTAQLEYANGQLRRLPLNVCHHFNAAKRIDYCRVFSPNPFLTAQ